MKSLKTIVSLIIVISFLFTGCTRIEFDGSRTSNDKQFLLEYKVLNTTKTHEVELKQGDKVEVKIEDQAGSVDIQVTNMDSEKEIYRGDKASSGDFILEIRESGTYLFSVTGKKAKGSVSFLVKE